MSKPKEVQVPSSVLEALLCHTEHAQRLMDLIDDNVAVLACSCAILDLGFIRLVLSGLLDRPCHSPPERPLRSEATVRDHRSSMLVVGMVPAQNELVSLSNGPWVRGVYSDDDPGHRDGNKAGNDPVADLP